MTCLGHLSAGLQEHLQGLSVRQPLGEVSTCWQRTKYAFAVQHTSRVHTECLATPSLATQ